MSEARAGRRSTDNPAVLRPKVEWRQYKGGVYRYMVYLTPKQEGGFSAIAARLPSVSSQGSTEQEALANIVEAFKKAIARYKEQGVAIPWMKAPVEPACGAITRWVMVHI
jgi:predicted RNase H-like HicB family nuclease